MQSLPKGHPALGCFFLSEHAPWYNLVASAGLPPGAEKPLETILVGARPFAPLAVANLTYYYLRIPDSPGIVDDPRASFLAYENGKFIDVTGDVRSRSRAVRFYDNRPPS
jgi:hypothetical protein